MEQIWYIHTKHKKAYAQKYQVFKAIFASGNIELIVEWAM